MCYLFPVTRAEPNPKGKDRGTNSGGEVGVQVRRRSFLDRNSLNKTHCFGRSTPPSQVTVFLTRREYSTSECARAFARQHFTHFEM